MLSEMLVSGPRPGSTGFIGQRSSKDGHQIVQDGHSHYQQAVLDGNVWIGANPLGTPVTTQAGLSATTPALTLFNPYGSGKLLVLWRITVGLNAAPAAASTLVLAANITQLQAIPASNTLGTITNANLGLAGGLGAAVGQCYRITTLPAAPVAVRYLGSVSAASLVAFAQIIDNVDGELVLQPGVAISIQATTAAAIFGSFTWEEVPV
jgi:hypothetical protein